MLHNCFSYLLTVLIVFSVYKQIIKSITFKKTRIVMNAKIQSLLFLLKRNLLLHDLHDCTYVCINLFNIGQIYLNYKK